MPDHPKPAYSVITLTHNRLPWTRRCLPTWLESGDSAWELIVVDNGSADETPAWLNQQTGPAAAQGIALRIIRNLRNLGCSTARNQALAEARADWVVFIDNDVALRSVYWLSRLRRTIESQSGAELAGAKLLYPVAPFSIQCAGAAISPSGRVSFRGRGQARDEARFNRLEPVQCLISACLMARTATVRRSGGFDAVYNPVQFEDFDLCYRIREAGGVALYQPAVEMYHFESTTTQGSASLHNPAVVIRNGLTFKNRWRHMFSQEQGPEPETRRWQHVTLPAPQTVAPLPRDQETRI